jgi:4-amino-4-deoxy-L-arabinose transferase-like glycosyltransferase
MNPLSFALTSRFRSEPTPEVKRTKRRAAVALVLILLLALGLRLYRLVPQGAGLLYAQDADEGVYASTAQLILQGYVPYRDFFTPMPPIAIYLFAIVLRVFYHPWGSATGLMALRYMSVACGIVTVGLTYCAAKVVGGKRAGLLAAAVLAVDGIVVAQDRRAMLEAPTNMYSVLAVLCYLYALHQAWAERLDGTIWRKQALLLAASGFFCTHALLTKGTALAPVLVIALGILLRRRWKEGLWFGGSLLASYLLFSSVFLILCPGEYVKQNYVFHLLRPWDGTAHPLARLTEILGYTWSWTTVRLSILGVATTLLAGSQVRHRGLWLVVLAWAGLMLVLLLTSRTYWATYFSQLAVPLSILAGLLFNDQLDRSRPSMVDRFSAMGRWVWFSLQLVVLVAVLAFSPSRLWLQYTTTKAALEQVKPAYLEISEYIGQYVPPDAPLLAFETNYTFLSSRRPAGAREGSFFIDSYGEMLYRSLGIPDMSTRDVFAAWLGQERVGSLAVFYRQPAQTEVRRVFDQAPYVVFDGRALKQLTPETTEYIRVRSESLESAHGADLRVRTSDAGAEEQPVVP